MIPLLALTLLTMTLLIAGILAPYRIVGVSVDRRGAVAEHRSVLATLCEILLGAVVVYVIGYYIGLAFGHPLAGIACMAAVTTAGDATMTQALGRPVGPEMAMDAVSLAWIALACSYVFWGVR